MKGPHQQRGVALLVAILMVALAAILAVKVGFDAYVDYRRASTLYALDQGFQVAMGAEAWAADFLASDFNKNKTETHLGQQWATQLPPIPIDNGELLGRLEDMQGRFNINNLLITPPPGNPGGTPGGNPGTPGGPVANTNLDQFKRLLELAEIEPEWGEKILDWLDADSIESFPEGAEDNAYSAESPPYLSANRPITRVSELLALKEFGLERYQRLEPLISALPIGTKINLCTAPGAVLDSFAYASKLTQFSLASQSLMQQRGSGCWPHYADLEKNLNTAEKLHAEPITGTMSDYFRGTIIVTIGTNQFTLYSLLVRNSSGQVRAHQRSFGTS
jgi:general secretion pathway protein K